MKIIKKQLKKVFIKLGYDVIPSSQRHVRFSVFENLIQAFEQKLRESGDGIPSNSLRPELMARLVGTAPSEAYFIVQGLNETKNINGDVCEFGVAQGETSALIANEIATGSKNLHLFDSFEGLPKPTKKDELKDDIFSLGSIEAYEGKIAHPEDKLLARLKAISFPEDRYLIHKGFIENIIHDNDRLPKKVSFAYVDFDFYEPIKTTLDFLHTTTPIGAKIIVDDYDYFSTGAKVAVDEFLSEKNADEKQYDFYLPNNRYGHFAILTKLV